MCIRDRLYGVRLRFSTHGQLYRAGMVMVDLCDAAGNELWTIAQELLVGWFCIILLCFNELMVKVKIILLTGFQLTSSKQGIDQ